MSRADQVRRRKATGPRHWTVEEVRRKLAGPLEFVIDDAVAYWLEDDEGHRLTPDASRTLAPFARALELHRAGMDFDRMLLCARLETGQRYEIGGGPSLIAVAEAAAGLPRRAGRAST